MTNNNLNDHNTKIKNQGGFDGWRSDSDVIFFSGFIFSAYFVLLVVFLIFKNIENTKNHWVIVAFMLIAPFFISYILAKKYGKRYINIMKLLLKDVGDIPEEEFSKRRQASLEYQKTHILYRYTIYLLIFLVVVTLLWITIFTLTK